MDINYDTNRLIILNYPAGAGGKFISLCLAISDEVLHQDNYLAKKKMSHKMDIEHSHRIGRTVINKSENSRGHFELGCQQFAGFNVYTKENQEYLANDTWRYCTNQSKYYFCMMNNARTNSWQDYRNARHIVLKNYDWLLQKRNIDIPEPHDLDSFGHFVEFDMRHCLDAKSFVFSFFEMLEKLGLTKTDPALLEDMRQCFLNKCEIGFNDHA